MGEVYRARDLRLGREVAVKVLPAGRSDPEQNLRLAREARLAGNLNHPNILAVFDVGLGEAVPYVVSELLHGETLRDRIGNGPLAVRKAVDYAIQTAQGLAAAHDKGIYHRDIKPENLFITSDGRLKILDFGLAKVGDYTLSDQATGALEVDLSTESGIVLGTVGYMSPEQARGQPADHRTDIFALGAVLYEMLSGRRAFQAASALETLHAILKDDPRSLLDGDSRIPAPLWHIVQHCLEKSPDERFQSARDLAFQLRELQGLSISGSAVAVGGDGGRLRKGIAAIGLGAVALAAALWAGRTLGPVSPPRFQPLTFRRGTVLSARFAPDGRSILYSAAWDGAVPEIWMTLPGRPDSRSLDLSGASIFAVSPAGEMAVSLGHHYTGGERFTGTLARASLGGGTPREVVEGVEDADWSPDGAQLAIVRSTGRASSSSRLEYPIGTVLLTTNGAIGQPRVSRRGDQIAFLEDPSGVGFGGTISVVDLSGRKTTLTSRWGNIRGLGWSPGGDELWFTAGEETGNRALRAVTLSGEERMLAEVPGSVTLRDVGRDGRVLLSQDNERGGILALVPGQAAERELSWFDRSGLADLSADGRMMLFGDQLRVYARRTDGSRAVHLGDGYADTLSRDGKWALTTSADAEQLVLLPMGAGEAVTLTRHGLQSYAGSWWIPGDRVLFNGREPGRGLRSYVQGLDGSKPQPVTPEGEFTVSVLPDGRSLATTSQGRGLAVRVLGEPEGSSRPLRGSEPGDRPAGWSSDGQTVWVFRRGEIPAHVYRIDLASGRRELWRSLVPMDPAGVFSVTNVVVTPDAKAYGYSYRRVLSDLYLVQGLR